jgi:hypothetical protein
MIIRRDGIFRFVNSGSNISFNSPTRIIVSKPGGSCGYCCRKFYFKHPLKG